MFSVGSAQTGGCWAIGLSVDRPALVTVDRNRVPITKVDIKWPFWCEIELGRLARALIPALGLGRGWVGRRLCSRKLWRYNSGILRF